MERIALVFAPHPDDAEIGMGGTIACLRAAGQRVVVADLTDGEPTPFGSVELRAQEAKQAAKILDVERENLGLKNREIFDTVENRKKVATLIRRLKPDLLFAPYWEDAHPDHWQACALIEAARFYSKFVKSDLDFTPHYPRRLFHYVACHIRPKIQPAFIFDISSSIDKKLQSLEAYQSQFRSNPNNADVLERLREESAFWGRQIGASFGEPFICRENIKLNCAEALFNA